MNAAFLTWLGLLAVAQGSGETTYMGDRELKIPITLPANPTIRSQIDQLYLYVSTDEGKTWRQEAVATPEQEHIAFYAPKDGVYWFTLQILDKQKKAYPVDVGSAPADLKVVVDTRNPLVRLQAGERQGQQISVSWQVSDEHLEPSSLRLEYRTADSGSWTPAPLSAAGPSGQRQFSVGTTARVQVRMQAQDLAGNQGGAQIEIPEAPTPPVTLAAAPPAAPAVIPEAQPATPRPAAPSLPPSLPPSNPNWSRPPEVNPAPSLPPRMEPPASRPMVDPAARLTSAPAPAPTPPAVDDQGWRVIARTEPGAAAPGSPAANPSWAVSPGSPASLRSRAGGPTLQFINTLNFDLNYEVSRVGPSGVGSVDLWVTQDDGRTWRRFAEDPDFQPPINVELPSEGLYGFTLVVRSRAGLGRKDPVPGEAPEMRLDVDTTAPVAELYRVEADPRQRDTLILSWSATDRNLTARPVTLLWSDKPGGDWRPIQADLPNNTGPTTGRHAWKMPPGLPYRVYLRIEVKDLAGNLAVAETPEPVLVDLTEPEGKLTGVVAVPRK